jgi:hypothetical protein
MDHQQECAKHKAQHPWWGHIVSQQVCEQVAERHPTLLRQKHYRQDPSPVGISG